MKTSEIRKEAREALKGKWGKAVCITLAFMAISMVIGFIGILVGEETTIYNIIEISHFIINIPLLFGLLISFIKLKRGEEVKVYDFFNNGFSKFKKSWSILFHTILKLLLPIICLFIVFLIFILGFVVATTNGFIFSFNAESFIIIAVILYIPTIVYITIKSLLYVLAYNISYDNPELSSKECVLKSAELMKGNRIKYLLLVISFIGWYVLLTLVAALGLFIIITKSASNVVTLLYSLMIPLGISLLISYIQVSVVCFYENLQKLKQ